MQSPGRLRTSGMRFHPSHLAGIAGVLACALLFAACENPKVAKLKADKAELEARLRHYSALTLASDSAGIAAMFAPNGEMVNPKRPPVRGRAAIEAYLAGFAGFHVISNLDELEGTAIEGDSAEQVGTYRQSVRTPDGQVFETKGRFEIAWVRDASGGWLLSQAATFPSN